METHPEAVAGAPAGNRREVKLKSLFWIAFVLGVLAAVLGSSVGIPAPDGVRAVFAGWLSAPGVLITLPLHNLIEAWWWAPLVIALGNGLIYGAAALVIGKLRL